MNGNTRAMIEQFLADQQEGEGLIVIRVDKLATGGGGTLMEVHMTNNIHDRVELAEILLRCVDKARRSGPDETGLSPTMRDSDLKRPTPADLAAAALALAEARDVVIRVGLVESAAKTLTNWPIGLPWNSAGRHVLAAAAYASIKRTFPDHPERAELARDVAKIVYDVHAKRAGRG